MRRPLLKSALVLCLVSACTCGGQPSRSAEEFADKDAPLIVSVPSLGGLADHVDALKSTARDAGNTMVVQYLAQAAGNLGFDPFTRAGQKEAGLDPDRSMVVVGIGRRGGYVALPYSNQEKLTATIKRLGPDRLGATIIETRKTNDVDVTAYVRAAGGVPEFAYVTKDKFLLVAMGDGAVEAVAAASKRKAEESASKAGPFPAAKTKIGTRDIYFFAPNIPRPVGDQPLIKLLRDILPQSFNAGLLIGANEIALRAAIPVAAGSSSPLSQALVGGATPLDELPAGQPAYFRGGVDWASVINTLGGSTVAGGAITTLREAFQKAGIDFDKDVVANMQPGFALTINLASSANFASAMNLDPTRQNPFQNYSVIALGHVKDAAKAQAAFSQLPKAIESFGTTISTHQVEGVTVYTASYSLGQGLSWALHADEIIAVGGLADRLDTVLAAIIKGGVKLPKDEFSPHAAEALFGTSGLAFALDFTRLAEASRKAQVGGGPGAYMVKAFVDNSLKNFSHFRPVVSITPSADSVTVDIATNVK